MVEEKYEDLLKKVERITKEKKLDLSASEDLSIAIMNLISIEEHLFFTAEKTGKENYFELLREVREMRKELLKKIIKDYEGEVWCVSKHLLAASMRLIEVGTKELNEGNKNGAKSLFDKAYKLWSLFWGINLKLVGLDDVERDGEDKSEIDCLDEQTEKGIPLKGENVGAKKKTSVWDKLGKIVQRAVDCCRE